VVGVLELSMEYKKMFRILGRKAKWDFLFLNFMVYKNGNSNCRQPGVLIVVDQVLSKKFYFYFFWG
jgi:hypothetical protein